MGVYIENIHMPEDGEHPLWISLHSDGTVEYNANKGDGWQMTTAVPVPPHGDLFDITKVKITPSDGEDIAYEIDFGNTIIPAEPAEEGE